MINGAYRQGAEFWQHSFFVLLTPLVLIVPLIGLSLLLSPSSQPSACALPCTHEEGSRLPTELGPVVTSTRCL